MKLPCGIIIRHLNNVTLHLKTADLTVECAPMRTLRPIRFVLLSAFLAPLAAAETEPQPAAEPLELAWGADLAFFGDNTEFSNPFREGETIFGAQVRTWLEMRPFERASFHVGVFADQRFESDADFELQPLLGFRYSGEHTDFLVGTLETVERHGFLEVLFNSQLELTRPVESGVQLLVHSPRFDGDFFINWQELNLPNQREVFDFGARLDAGLIDWLNLSLQVHGEHHGGQLFMAGMPVWKNVAVAGGAEVHGRLRGLGESSFEVHGLHCNTDVPPAMGAEEDGGGILVRASIRPVRRLETWLLGWRGNDWFAVDGDRHYSSVGLATYDRDRDYAEAGARYRWTGRGRIDYDLQARVHRVEDELDTSFRFVIRVPLRLGPWTVRRG